MQCKKQLGHHAGRWASIQRGFNQQQLTTSRERPGIGGGLDRQTVISPGVGGGLDRQTMISPGVHKAGGCAPDLILGCMSMKSVMNHTSSSQLHSPGPVASSPIPGSRATLTNSNSVSHANTHNSYSRNSSSRAGLVAGSRAGPWSGSHSRNNGSLKSTGASCSGTAGGGNSRTDWNSSLMPPEVSHSCAELSLSR